jgi:type III pantothenate kinase
MLIALDVGNTNITIGRFDGHQLLDVSRVETREGASIPRLTAVLDAPDGADVVVASVVPQVTAMVMEFCAERGLHLLVADAATLPMSVRVARPAEVGPDRLVNALAALRLYGAPAIVVDLGTATTFDVVDAGGAFVGGAIAPGIQLGADALASQTALLPKVDLELPAHAIGTDTVSAIQSGVVIGYIGLVRELVATISAELAGNRGKQPKVILTGGLSQAEWAAEIHADEIDPELTLRGLAILAAEVGAVAAAVNAPAEAPARS